MIYYQLRLFKYNFYAHKNQIIFMFYVGQLIGLNEAISR